MAHDPHAEFRDDPEYMKLVEGFRSCRMVYLGASDFDALIGKLSEIRMCLSRIENSPASERYDHADQAHQWLNEAERILRHAENPDYTAGGDDVEQARRQI